MAQERSLPRTGFHNEIKFPKRNKKWAALQKEAAHF